MPIYEVEGPDGKVYEIEGPAGATAEQLGSVITGAGGKPQDGPIERGLKVAGSAVARGVASLPAAIGDAIKLGVGKVPAEQAAVYSKLPGVGQFFGAFADAARETPNDQMVLSKGVQALGTQPQTSGEKWNSAILEGAAGGLVGPGSLARPGIALVSGAGAGAGGEAAGRLTNDNSIARLLGSLGGGLTFGGIASALSNLKPQTKTLAKEMLEGITDQQLSDAQNYMIQAKAAGKDVDLAQALTAVGARVGDNVKSARDLLANNRWGNETQRILREQPAQLETAAKTAVASLPVNPADPTRARATMNEAANAVQKAATDRVKQVRDFRQAQAGPMYDQAGALSPTARQQIESILIRQADAPGGTPEFTKEALDSLAALRTGIPLAQPKSVNQAMEEVLLRGQGSAPTIPQASSVAQALSEQQTRPWMVQDAARLGRELQGKFKGSPLTNPNAAAERQGKAAGAQIIDALEAQSDPLKVGNQIWRELSESQVDPTKQLLGGLATPRGARPDVQASAAKLNQLFTAGADTGIPAARRDLPRIADELAKVDKDAVPDAVKAFLRQRLDTAFGGVEKGGANQRVDSAQVLYDSLFKEGRQREGMRDMVAAVARSYGQDEAAAVQGMENLAKLTQAMANRPSTVSGVEKADFKELAGATKIANVLRGFGFMPFERAARGVEEATMGRTFRDLDKMLTSPEGVEALRKIGREPLDSRMAAAVSATLAGTTPQAGKVPERRQ